MIFISSQGDFSRNSIGTLDISRVITELTIESDTSISGMQYQMTARANYDDGTTALISPTWSITTGSIYASINSSSGMLTINEGANNATVIVQAVSGGYLATKTISVTFKYDITFEVQIADLSNYNGAANSIEYNGNLSSGDSTGYSFILPCKSGRKIAIQADAITFTFSGDSTPTEYQPELQALFGFNLNEYDNGFDNYAAARVVVNQSYYTGYAARFANNPVSLPVTIPKQYNSAGTSQSDNIPYVGFTMKWKNPNHQTYPTYSIAYWPTMQPEGVQGKKIRVRIYED